MKLLANENLPLEAVEALREAGYEVASSTSPLPAIEEIKKNPPDLLLLDVRLPGKDGYDVCREIKADPRSKKVPVIMISVKSEGADVVIGLEIGAEDYIRKPFDERELLARVKAALRRGTIEPTDEIIHAGPITINLERYEVLVDKKPLKLTPKEFELLTHFVKNQGRVLTRPKISEYVWGIEYNPSSKTIEFHVDQIRKKLGKYGGFVTVLKGVGYRFEVEDSN